jgi:hypothetical protein
MPRPILTTTLLLALSTSCASSPEVLYFTPTELEGAVEVWHDGAARAFSDRGNWLAGLKTVGAALFAEVALVNDTQQSFLFDPNEVAAVVTRRGFLGSEYNESLVGLPKREWMHQLDRANRRTRLAAALGAGLAGAVAGMEADPTARQLALSRSQQQQELQQVRNENAAQVTSDRWVRDYLGKTTIFPGKSVYGLVYLGRSIGAASVALKFPSPSGVVTVAFVLD